MGGGGAKNRNFGTVQARTLGKESLTDPHPHDGAEWNRGPATTAQNRTQDPPITAQNLNKPKQKPKQTKQKT